MNRRAKECFDSGIVGAQQVEDMLRHAMDDWTKQGNDDDDNNNNDKKSERVQPNVVSFTAVLNAWARAAAVTGRTSTMAVDKAESILRWMLDLSSTYDGHDANLFRPNVHAYNAVITAWVRTTSVTDSHVHAERLLSQFWDSYQDLYETSNNSNNDVISAPEINDVKKVGKENTMIIDKEEKDGDEEGQNHWTEEYKPNARSFDIVINSIARRVCRQCGGVIT